MKNFMFLILSIISVLFTLEKTAADSHICRSSDGSTNVVSRTLVDGKMYIVFTNIHTGTSSTHIRKEAGLLTAGASPSAIFDIHEKQIGTAQRISKDTFKRTYSNGTSITDVCDEPQ